MDRFVALDQNNLLRLSTPKAAKMKDSKKGTKPILITIDDNEVFERWRFK